MAKRTIYLFRAEKGVWLSELAERLEMTEQELTAIEQDEIVSEEIAEKIIDFYGLPENYFTEEVKSPFKAKKRIKKITPKKPFGYFLGISIVWMILVSFVLAVIQLPKVASTVTQSGGAPQFLAIFELICSTLITAVSGVYLSTFIMRRTTYGKRVTKYEFLYPYFLNKMILFPVLLNILILVKPNLTDKTLLIINSVVSVAEVIVAGVMIAFMLMATITESKKLKDKIVYILCGSNALLQIASFGLYWFNSHRVGASLSTQSILSFVIRMVFVVLIAFGMTIGEKKFPKLNKLWFTIIPLVAIILPTVISIVTML